MSATIDERVVEMRFDSKQFQAEAKSTLGVLDRLKEALKFTDAGKGLEELNKSVKDVRLDGIASGIEMLTKRFSTFGIVGMQIIQNVTNALTGKLVGAVRYAEDAIVSGGIRRAMNIENAHFQLQALLKDETKVQEVMANAMESVDGTAYAYDEAAKAASMFAASGIQAGDDMLNALKGITGVAAMTNSEFESISMIFTTVAGNGRLMGDQLLQLSSRGLNAASTIADYMREVQKQTKITENDVRDMVSEGKISFKTFSDAMNWAFGDSAKRANETFTGAMSNMKSALARIGAGFVSPLVEQNGVLVDAFNTLRVKINEIKSELVFDEETSAVKGFSQTLGMSAEEAQKFYDKVEKAGKVTIKNIEKIKSHGQDGYKELKEYFNGINDGSIRASYSITETVKKLTKGNEVTRKDIKKFVKQGKVDFDIFSAAYERAFGADHQKLSKQFTDTVTTVVDTIRKEVEKFDVTKITNTLYKGFNSLKNVLYGFYTVLKPVGLAFADVFLGFNYNDISDFATNIEKLTAKFKLSDESADKLRRTFRGVFDIFALLGDGLIALIRSFTPFGSTIKEGSGSLLDLTANLGDTLTEFSKWVRTSPKVQEGFEKFSKAVANAAKFITIAGHHFGDFVTKVWEMEKTQQIIKWIGDIFVDFGDTVQTISKQVVESVSSLVRDLTSINFSTPQKSLEGISNAFINFGSALMKNEGIRAFVENFKEFLSEVGDALSKDSIEAKIDGLKNAFSKLFDILKNVATFLKDTFSPLLEELSLGGVLSAGLGVGVFASVSKISKAMESVTKPIESISGVLNSVKNAVEAYQKDLQAAAILKIAAAIGVLAGALVILSFADTDRLLGAAMALSVIAGVLFAGVTALLSVVKKGDAASDALSEFADHIGSALTQVGKGIKWKMIGDTFKSFGVAVAIIAASIAGLSVLYKYNPSQTTKAFDMIKQIALGMVGVTAAMSILGKLVGSGMASFQKAAIGMAAMSAAMLLIVTAMGKIMKMDLPKDYKSRMLMLTAIFGELAALTLVVGISSRIAGGESLSPAPILALCGVLLVAVGSLKKLFAIDLPKDYKTKLAIFAGIFAEMAILAIAVGAASRISNGEEMVSGPILAMCAFLYAAVGALKKVMNMKFPSDWGVRFAAFELMFITLGAIIAAVVLAGRSSEEGSSSAKTILAMCAFLGAAASALMVLSIIPAAGLLKGAIALGAVLLSLAVTLKSVSKISDNGADKTVLAMAEVIGAITASLGVLSMISWENLAKSCLALGSMLLALAVDFRAISKINNEKVWMDILAMVGAMAAIVAALSVLTKIPMDELVAAAASLSAVLLSFSGALYIVSNAKKIKKEQMLAFLAASVILVPITASLAALAGQPWEGLLAASASISIVMLSFAETMKMMSSRTGIKMEKMQAFLLASLVLVPITASLAVLANQPWEGLLAASVSLSATLLAYAEAMKIASSSSGINLAKMAIFLAGSLAVVPIVIALSMLAGYDWQALLAAGAAISAVMLSLSASLAIISLVGSAVPAAIAGILLLDALIADLVLVLLALGKIYEIPGIDQLLSGGGDVLGKIGEAFGKLVSGIGVGLASGLPAIGKSLSEFAINVVPFVTTMQMFASSNAVKGCMEIVKMILALTAASFIQGVSNFLSIFTGGSSLQKLGQELTTFGPYIKKFSEDVSGINVGAVAAASAAGQMIAKLYEALPKQGGWMQVIMGETMTLTQFARELISFGPSIAKFADQVKDVKPEAVKGAASAAKIVAKVYDELPKTGGWMQVIMGQEMSLSQFGFELTIFGPSIAKFADQVKDVKPEAVKGASSAAKIMAKLYEELPVIGGLKAKIFGETMSLSMFGKELRRFGPKLADFADDVKDIDATSVDGAANVASIMSELADGLPDTKNLGEKIFGGGTMTLTEFGTQLVNFAPHIVNFADAVDEIDPEDVKGAMEAIDLIVDTITMITSAETAKTSLTAFGEQLKKFGESLVTFYNQMVKTDFSEVSTITANIKKLVEVAKDAGEQGASGFVKAINDQNGSVTKAINAMITKATNTLKNNQLKFKIRGQDAGQKFIDGITNKLANNIVAMKKNAANLGKYYVQGFAQGINNNLAIASRAAASMAKKADEAVAKTLDEHSPSKVAEQRGVWYTGGLIIGLLKETNDLKKAAQTIANTLDSSTSSQIKRNHLSLQKDFDEFAKLITENAKSIRRSVYDNIDYAMKESYTTTQNRLNSMIKAIEKANRTIDTLQKNQDRHQKEQEKQEELQKAYEEEVQKQEEALKHLEELSKMSKKEREKQLKEEKKEAERRALAEKIAYKKIYGDQKKYLGQTLDMNADYYKNLIKIKNTGNNKALYEDKSFEEAEIDILKRVTETLQSYKEKFESERESIMNEVNFFEEVDKDKEVKTKDQLFQNAKDQLELYQEYITTQRELKARLEGTELYKYLETLGVDSTNQLKIINSMTEDELDQYVSLYDRKFELATIAARDNLDDYQEEIENQLEDILGGVVKDIDLYSFMEQFDGKLTSVLGDKKVKKNFKKTITEFYKSVSDPSKLFGVPFVSLFASGLKEDEISGVVDQMPGITKELQKMTSDTADKVKPTSEKAGKTIATAAKTGVTKMYGDFYDVGVNAGKKVAYGLISQAGEVKRAADQLRAAASAASYSGSMVSSGFASGVSSGVHLVRDSLENIAKLPINVFSSSLKIHSPSRVMDEYGRYTVLGYINGMMSMLANVASTSSKVAESSKSGFEDGTSSIGQLFEDMLIDPVITPIVDMSNVRRSIDDINRMFNDSIRTVSIGAMDTSSAFNDQLAQRRGAANTSSTTNYFTFEQNNTSPKSLSTIDIYRNTKNQFTQFRERVEGV